MRWFERFSRVDLSSALMGAEGLEVSSSSEAKFRAGATVLESTRLRRGLLACLSGALGVSGTSSTSSSSSSGWSRM